MSEGYDYRVDDEIDPRYAPCFLVTYLRSDIELMIDSTNKIYIRKSLHDDWGLMLKLTEESYQLAKKSKLTKVTTLGNVYCADFKTSEILVDSHIVNIL